MNPSTLSARLTRFLSRAGAFTRDSASLCSSLVTKQATSRGIFKDILLEHARRDGNTAAMSLLRIDRTLGLVRYHGPLWYLRNNFFPAISASGIGMGAWKVQPTESLSTSSSQSASSSATVASTGASGISSISDVSAPKKAARVAFMVTSAQRRELRERLGYDPSEIRKLTPTQALLILEHSVSPENVEFLNQLMEENDSLRLQEEEELTRRREQQQLQLETSEKRQVKDPSPLATTGSAEEGGSENVTGDWFEVVEFKTMECNEKDMSTTGIISGAIPVALYRSEEEANTFVSIKEELAAKWRDKDGGDAEEQRIRYQVRRRHHGASTRSS